MAMIHYWEDKWHVGICTAACMLLIGGCVTTETMSMMTEVAMEQPITTTSPAAPASAAPSRVAEVADSSEGSDSVTDDVLGESEQPISGTPQPPIPIAESPSVNTKPSSTDSALSTPTATAGAASSSSTVTPQSEAISEALVAAPNLSATASDPAVSDGEGGVEAANSPLNELLAGVLALFSQDFTSQGLRDLEELDLTIAADPTLVSAVASYVFANQRPLLAIRLYQKNLGAVEPFNREALRALVDLELSRGEFENAQRYASQLLQLGYPLSETALLSLADYAMQAQSYDDASRLLDRFAASVSQSELYDRYLWMRGQLLEQDAERRDIKDSIFHYEQIVNQYPFSTYWEPARIRSQYLTRHFIDLR